MPNEIRAILPKFSDDMDLQLEQAKYILGEKNVFVSKINVLNVERQIEKFLGLSETNISLTWEKH